MAHEFLTGLRPIARYMGVFLLAALLGGCGSVSDVGAVSGITDAVAKAQKNEALGGKVPLAVMCDNSRDAESVPSDLL